MTEARKVVIDNIKTICKLRNIKNKQIAEQMNVSEGSISNWFSGRNAIDIDNLYKLCCLLDVSLDQVFGIRPLRPEIILSDDEARLVAEYRTAAPTLRKAAMNVLISGRTEKKIEKKDTDQSAI